MDDDTTGLGQSRRRRMRRDGEKREGEWRKMGAKRVGVTTKTAPFPPLSLRQWLSCLIWRWKYCLCLGGKRPWWLRWIHKACILYLCLGLSTRPPLPLPLPCPCTPVPLPTKMWKRIYQRYMYHAVMMTEVGGGTISEMLTTTSGRVGNMERRRGSKTA